QVNGDTVIPNEAYTETLGNAQPAPLSGTEPLAKAMNAPAAGITTAGGHALPGIVRFTTGTHSTPVLPTTGTDEEADAFAEMVGQTGSIVGSGGNNVAVTDTSVIQQ